MTSDNDIQEEILELNNEFDLKQNFEKVWYLKFWKHPGIFNEFAKLCSKIKLFFIGFPSSYLVEQGFSSVNHILNKKRNHLDLIARKDIQLFVSDSSIKEDMFDAFYKNKEEKEKH